MKTGNGLLARIRLVSGLILFGYVCAHLVNHSLGLVSLETLEAGRVVFLGFWRAPGIQWLTPTALAAHMGLALWSLIRRKTLRMPSGEIVQTVLGLLVPFILLGHITATRFAASRFGLDDSYTYLNVVWGAPYLALDIALLTITWLHGCLGLYYWLRLKSGYARFARVLYTGALLVPVLAVLGAVASHREVGRLAEDPAWLAAFEATLPASKEEILATQLRIADSLIMGYAGVLALLFISRAAWLKLREKRNFIEIKYPDGSRVRVYPGVTILEASRLGGVPHAAVCGGRGRCSTCRVRIDHGQDELDPPAAEESRVLERVGAPSSVRLACQSRPRGSVGVTPLLSPRHATAQDGFRRQQYFLGQEKEVAILFADLRGFTEFAEHRLPFDVVFILNQYFQALGVAVEAHGGHIDKFMGDGMMALFGVETDIEAGCQNALQAARALGDQLAALNERLAHDLTEPLRIGIGVHCGQVIVGEMGYKHATTLTAIGDAVNTASRLETMTKDFACQLVVSEDVALRSGRDFARFESRAIDVRGRSQALRVFVVPRCADL